LKFPHGDAPDLAFDVVSGSRFDRIGLGGFPAFR
jgi:hypothetical protein